MEPDDKQVNRKNRRLLYGLVTLVVFMAIFPWVNVPFWRHLCGLIGLRPTSDQSVEQLFAEAATGKDTTTTVTFMGVSGEVPIEIEPLVKQAEVRPGEVYTAMYRLKNVSGHDIDYRAIHSTVPANDPSFELIKCFCDDHRVIKAGAVEEWPVVFRLTKPVDGMNGLTVNYTIFDYTKNAK